MVDRLTTIPSINYPGNGYLYIDANILINFDRIGQLDLLTPSNRTVVITEEVYRDVERNVTASNDFLRSTNLAKANELQTGDYRLDKPKPVT